MKYNKTFAVILDFVLDLKKRAQSTPPTYLKCEIHGLFN